MAIWNFDPSQYVEKTFELIPVGDHRARVKEVHFRTFNSGNEGYEITFAVSGYNSTVKNYLVLNPADPAKTNQAIGSFFDSFGIIERELSDGHGWVGKVGAVRIRHEDYNGEARAKVAYCIARSKQDKLPAWKEPAGGQPVMAKPSMNDFTPVPEIKDLPF